MIDQRLHTPLLVLRYGIGLAAFLAGMDKFFNLLTDWEMYVSPIVTAVLPVNAAAFMKAVGIIEMVVGFGILTRWIRISAYVAGAWLLGIAVNLLTTGRFFDVAVRDVIMAFSAFTLARLTEVNSEAVASEPSRFPQPHHLNA